MPLARFMLRCGLILILAHGGWGWGQNLVPNPYFTAYDSCPAHKGKLHLAPPWYSPNGRTTDFAHECAFVGLAGIPNNRWGNQVPARGQGYAGIRTWVPPELFANRPYREYLAVPIPPLVPGKTYGLSFQLSPGEASRYLTDDVGLALVDSLSFTQHLYQIDPVLENPQGALIDDFIGWKKISGTYVAQGHERILVIGNFLPDSQTTRVASAHGDSLFESTYLFVDDIVLRPCEGLFPTDIILAMDSVFCAGGELPLELNPTLEYDAILWENGSTMPQRKVHQGGWAWVEVMRDGCRARDSIWVEELPQPMVELGNDTSLCPGESLTFSLAEPGIQYTWQDGQSGPNYRIEAAGTYAVWATQGPCQVQDSIQVRYTEEIPLMIGFDSLICEQASIQLGLELTEARYLWTDGFTEGLRQVNQAGTYTLNIETDCGQSQTSYHIQTQDCSCEAFIPNVFSPNQDGIHDLWRLRLAPGVLEAELVIVDRWGREVGRSRQLPLEWDGRRGGKPLPLGTYYWSLRYRCQEPSGFSTQWQQGFVTLLR